MALTSMLSLYCCGITMLIVPHCFVCSTPFAAGHMVRLMCCTPPQAAVCWVAGTSRLGRGWAAGTAAATAARTALLHQMVATSSLSPLQSSSSRQQSSSRSSQQSSRSLLRSWGWGTRQSMWLTSRLMHRQWQQHRQRCRPYQQGKALQHSCRATSKCQRSRHQSSSSSRHQVALGLTPAARRECRPDCPLQHSSSSSSRGDALNAYATAGAGTGATAAHQCGVFAMLCW